MPAVSALPMAAKAGQATGPASSPNRDKSFRARTHAKE